MAWAASDYISRINKEYLRKLIRSLLSSHSPVPLLPSVFPPYKPSVTLPSGATELSYTFAGLVYRIHHVMMQLEPWDIVNLLLKYDSRSAR